MPTSIRLHRIRSPTGLYRSRDIYVLHRGNGSAVILMHVYAMTVSAHLFASSARSLNICSPNHIYVHIGCGRTQIKVDHFICQLTEALVAQPSHDPWGECESWHLLATSKLLKQTGEWRPMAPTPPFSLAIVHVWFYVWCLLLYYPFNLLIGP